MYTIEFESHLHHGLIKIPDRYQDWFGKSVKVILLPIEPDVQETNPVSKPRRLPKGAGLYHSGRSDISERAEELLFQTEVAVVGLSEEV